jgi:hypothetical protein
VKEKIMKTIKIKSNKKKRKMMKFKKKTIKKMIPNKINNNKKR